MKPMVELKRIGKYVDQPSKLLISKSGLGIKFVAATIHLLFLLTSLLCASNRPPTLTYLVSSF